jgi:hypothetical protein
MRSKGTLERFTLISKTDYNTPFGRLGLVPNQKKGKPNVQKKIPKTEPFFLKGPYTDYIVPENRNLNP